MKSSFIVAGNWKMNKSPSEAVSYLKDFNAKLKISNAAKVVFFVPAIDLWVTEQALRSTGVEFGAQNCYFENSGAFTGENSPQVLSEIGAKHCLVGHSERRQYFHETNDLLAKKIASLQKNAISPMYCIGETLADRETNKTNQVLEMQLRDGLSQIDWSKPFTVAYEPVWAIGTGKVASLEQVDQAHQHIRQFLKSMNPKGNDIAILYGGSVKPDNAKDLSGIASVNGFLVGGASLKVDDFLQLIPKS